MSKGILELLKEAPAHNYDSSKSVTLAKLVKTMADLSRLPPQKPEYILSKHEAETLTIWELKGMGNNYKVLCSVEVANIIKNREENELKAPALSRNLLDEAGVWVNQKPD